MIIDFADLSANACYHLMTQTIIPRPIAWVLTTNDDGESHNLAPFSYFNAISSQPPLLMFSCAPKLDGNLKDTVRNALSGRDFVIHIASDADLQAVQESARPLDYGKSELSDSQLSLCEFSGTNLLRLPQAPIAFACRLYHSQPIGDAPQTLIFAEIFSAYIDDNAVEKMDKRLTIEAQNINPLARLGLNQFATLCEVKTAKK